LFLAYPVNKPAGRLSERNGTGHRGGGAWPWFRYDPSRPKFDVVTAIEIGDIDRGCPPLA
jgi:hypothetical protein